MLHVYCGRNIPCSSLFMVYPLLGQPTDRDLFLSLWFKIFRESTAKAVKASCPPGGKHATPCVCPSDDLWHTSTWASDETSLTSCKQRKGSLMAVWLCLACSTHNRSWWTCCVTQLDKFFLHGYALRRLCQGWRWNSSEQKSFNSRW